ncbi:MAG TPA: hypothetical protein VG488_01040 [Candidatus Angelobacter sp.]|nr:hypothetical protein [Candidatus Angelobacter sp.]
MPPLQGSALILKPTQASRPGPGVSTFRSDLRVTFESLKEVAVSPRRGRMKVAQHGSALFFGAEPNAGLHTKRNRSPFRDG